MLSKNIMSIDIISHWKSYPKICISYFNNIYLIISNLTNQRNPKFFMNYPIPFTITKISYPTSYHILIHEST